MADRSTPARCSPPPKPTPVSPTGATPRFASASPRPSTLINARQHGRRRAQRAAAANIHWLLTRPAALLRRPRSYGLDREVIERPLFVTGEPRSGTTLLHALLSVDPDARALRFWEVMHPSPPPGLAAPDDPRRAQADAEWREINARLPKWLHSHPYNDMLGDGLPEDERTWAFDFRVMTPTAWWRVPMGMVVGGLPVRPARAIPHPPDDAAGDPARPAEEILGAEGLPRDALPRVLRLLSRCARALHPPRSGAVHRLAHPDGGGPHRGTDGLRRPWQQQAKTAHRARPRRLPRHPRQPDDRRSAHPPRALPGLRGGPGRHDPPVLRVCRPCLDARGRSGDARLSRQQQGRPSRQVRLLHRSHRWRHRRAARGVRTVSRTLRPRDRKAQSETGEAKSHARADLDPPDVLCRRRSVRLCAASAGHSARDGSASSAPRCSRRAGWPRRALH